MATQCDRCQKGILRGKQIARARQGLNYRSSRVFRPNLHVFRILINRRKIKLHLCTKCLRIVKAEEAAREAARRETSAKAAASQTKKKIVKKTKVSAKKTPVKSHREKRVEKEAQEAKKIAKLHKKSEKEAAKSSPRTA